MDVYKNARIAKKTLKKKSNMGWGDRPYKIQCTLERLYTRK